MSSDNIPNGMASGAHDHQRQGEDLLVRLHANRPFLALGVPCTLTLAAGVQKPGTSTLL